MLSVVLCPGRRPDADVVLCSRTRLGANVAAEDLMQMGLLCPGRRPDAVLIEEDLMEMGLLCPRRRPSEDVDVLSRKKI